MLKNAKCQWEKTKLNLTSNTSTRNIHWLVKFSKRYQTRFDSTLKNEWIDLKTCFWSKYDSFTTSFSEPNTLNSEYDVPREATNQDHFKHMVSQQRPPGNYLVPANDEPLNETHHEYTSTSIKSIITKFEKPMENIKLASDNDNFYKRDSSFRRVFKIFSLSDELYV